MSIVERGAVLERAWRDVVADRMRERGWSPGDLARHAGVPRSSLSYWVRGQRRIGSRELARVLDSLGVAVVLAF